MGGLESLEVGLTHTGQFAWIGGFSSAVHNLDYTQKLASLDRTIEQFGALQGLADRRLVAGAKLAAASWFLPPARAISACL